VSDVFYVRHQLGNCIPTVGLLTVLASEFCDECVCVCVCVCVSVCLISSRAARCFSDVIIKSRDVIMTS